MVEERSGRGLKASQVWARAAVRVPATRRRGGYRRDGTPLVVGGARLQDELAGDELRSRTS